MTSRRTAAAALLLTLGLSACVRGDWPGPNPIDPANWNIEIDACGPIDGAPLTWGEGRVINTTNERSPFYDIRYTITYTDGTTDEKLANEIVAPAAPGESSEFSFILVDPEGRTIDTCEMIVVDAVENYTG